MKRKNLKKNKEEFYDAFWRAMALVAKANEEEVGSFDPIRHERDILLLHGPINLLGKWPKQ